MSVLVSTVIADHRSGGAVAQIDAALSERGVSRQLSHGASTATIYIQRILF